MDAAEDREHLAILGNTPFASRRTNRSTSNRFKVNRCAAISGSRPLD
jgi:hypothetical protein